MGSPALLGAIHWTSPASGPLVMIWFTICTGPITLGRMVARPVKVRRLPMPSSKLFFENSSHLRAGK